MYTLYWSPGTASLCVHWMLIELGEPHELVKVDIEAGEHRKPEYLQAEPRRRRADAASWTASRSASPPRSCMILAERHPQAGFAPAGRPRAARGLHQLDVLPVEHAADRVPQLVLPGPAGGAGRRRIGEGLRAPAHRVQPRTRRPADRDVGRYLLGDRVTAADFVTTMLMRWSRNMPKPATEWPAIAGYVKRMKSRPSFKALYEREGLTEWA